MTTGMALFNTSIGRCGIAWGEHGVLAVQLPESDDAATFAGLRRKAIGALETNTPLDVSRACDAMIDLLNGNPVDLSFIALDMANVPDFNRKVYDVARTIPPGAIMTYGDIAVRLGDKLLARAIGKALGENPFPIIIPCHRVLAANGKTGGFSANGGVTTKFRMLSIEGARFANRPSETAPMLFEPKLSIAPRRHRS